MDNIGDVEFRNKVGAVVALIFLLVGIFFIFLTTKENGEVIEERPTYENNPAYIKEIEFEGNIIKSIIINNEMFTNESTAFKILPVAKDDKTNRYYYTYNGSQVTIHYKEGFDAFIHDYSKGVPTNE